MKASEPDCWPCLFCAVHIRFDPCIINDWHFYYVFSFGWVILLLFNISYHSSILTSYFLLIVFDRFWSSEVQGMPFITNLKHSCCKVSFNCCKYKNSQFQKIWKVDCCKTIIRHICPNWRYWKFLKCLDKKGLIIRLVKKPTTPEYSEHLISKCNNSCLLERENTLAFW